MRGAKAPPTEAALRGTEIHRVMAHYINHLVETRQASDWPKLEELAFGVSPEARQILASIEGSFEIDPEKVVSTEEHLMLTEDFQRTRDGKSAAYELTTDLREYLEAEHARITDFKSYFRLIDADSFQGVLYSLGEFCLNPRVEAVTFRLVFVRWGAQREITYTRADVPKMIQLVRGERLRQQRIWAEAIEGKEALAFPGRQCLYCPLLNDGCPWEKANPWDLGAVDRVRHAVYLKHALAETTWLLKEQVDAEDKPVEATDGNGARYQAYWGAMARKSFPLVETVPVLAEWCRETGEDVTHGLTVGGLSPLLKARKREALVERLALVADVKTQARFTIGEVGDDSQENGE